MRGRIAQPGRSGGSPPVSAATRETGNWTGLPLSTYLNWIILVLLALINPVPSATAQSAADWQTWGNEVMAPILAEHGVPNASIIVVGPDAVIYSQGFGLADIATARPMTPQTPVQVASVAKTMTFMGLLQLIDEGRLSLDDDVFGVLGLPQPEDGFGPLQVRHLLTHTDGFVDQTLGILHRDRSVVVPQSEVFTDQTAARSAQSGAVTTYGNFGTIAAGAIVEKLRETDFETAMVTYFYGPAGMDQSFPGVSPTDPRVADMVTEYQPTENGPAPIVQLNPKVAALVTTTEDMGRFAQLFLNGGRVGETAVLSEVQTSAMLSPQFVGAEGLPGLSHGLMEHPQGGLTAWRRDGHGLESRSRLLVFPTLERAVFLFVGSDDNPVRDQVSDAIFAQLGAAYDQPPQNLSDSACTAGSWSYGPVQNDGATYGSVQIWFAGLLHVVQQVDCALTITPMNLDAYGGLERASTWAPQGDGLFARTDDRHGLASLAQPGESNLILGTGMMATYRPLGLLERPSTHAGLAAVSALLVIVALIVGLKDLIQGQPSRVTIRLVAYPVLFLGYSVVFSWGAFMFGGSLPIVPAYAFGPNSLTVGAAMVAPLLLIATVDASILALTSSRIATFILAAGMITGLLLLYLINWLW